jgi:hypothetical protein
MSRTRLLAIVLLPFLLSGCLEVRQRPPWINGEFAGKADDRPFQRLFHGDRLAWFAAISNRMNGQNEYNRANP